MWLPDLSGYEALPMLRSVSSVPVLVITAQDEEAKIIRVLDASADDYVVKPCCFISRCAPGG